MKLDNFIKKKIFIVIIVVFLILASVGISFYLSNKQKFTQQNQPEIQTQTIHPPCLTDNEVADFKIKRGEGRKGIIEISIIDKDTNSNMDLFQVDTPSYNHYHPIEIHKCNIYVIRAPIYDYENDNLPSGAAYELWKYSYDGRGKKILILAEENKEGVFKSYFGNDFRIDPQEVYVALERGYSGRDDYALVIRDFNAQTDSFILLRQVLFEKYPELPGLFGLEIWTRDGNYFWADLSITANEIAFLRILRDTWELDVLPVPAGTLGGTALNSEYGYVTYDTGPGWIGIDVVAEQVYGEWRKAGKKVDFYLYNLFMQEKTLLATTDDPTWSFKPQWLSDTELQYELPSGERKIYMIE